MLTNTKLSYEWSTVLNFNARGNALPYCTSGWAEPESTLIWTDGLNAKMSFSAKPPKSNVSLIISCTPYLGDGKVPFQELHIFVNFLRVGFGVISQSTELDITIPTCVFNRPEVDIDLYVPRACSPASLSLGKDLRVLGVGVHRLMMAEV